MQVRLLPVVGITADCWEVVTAEGENIGSVWVEHPKGDPLWYGYSNLSETLMGPYSGQSFALQAVCYQHAHPHSSKP